MSYKCMKCSGTFESTAHARACYALAGAATTVNNMIAAIKVKVEYKRADPLSHDKRASLAVTAKQASTARRMADERHAVFEQPRNMLEASRLIAALGKMPKVKPAPAQTYTCPRCKRDYALESDMFMCPCPHTPQPPMPVTPPQPPYEPFKKLMLDKIPDGRYGVANNEMTQTVFMRKKSWAPDAKNKRLAGSTTVQVKSADVWHDAFIYWPSGKVSAYKKSWQGTDMNELLTMVFMDIGGSAQNYADKFSECSNCGIELTDDRSRYYGLGTDCIKRRTDIVNYVESTKGPYTKGAATV